MDSQVNYTAVGAFVIALTAAFILAVIWLSAGFSTQSYTSYKVYMNEAVTGLSIDSPVEYNGVNVGAVKKIRLNHKNPRLVEVLLSIKSNAPITQGTRAQLNVRSLSGVAYMALLDKGTNMRPLEPLPDQRYAVIPTIPSFLVRLDTALTQLSESIRQISGSVKTLLDPQNLHSIKMTLINLQNFTSTLSANSKNFDSILRNTSTFMQSSQGMMKNIQMQTLPAANQGVINFNNMSQNFSDMSAEIKNNPSVILRGNEPSALGPGE